MVQKEYSDERKAAVLAALLQGQSINSIAKQYEIPRSTIQGWRDAAGLNESALPRSKKNEIGDLLLQYLKVSLGTLSIQAEDFRDKAWIRRHSPSDAAVLHGVLTDKAIRLLEALARTEGETDEAAE